MGNIPYISVACAFVAALAAIPPSEANAQTRSVQFDLAFDLSIDCDQPKEFHDIPVRGEGSGVLNSDKTASADLKISTMAGSSIHFDASLGGAPRPAPGGSSILNVMGRDRLRLIWDLPTNQIITTIAVRGQNCTAAVDFKLKYGNHTYSMFDGQSFYFCKKPRLLGSSCTVK